MKKVIYTYSVVRYVHDPAAAEVLNVGILFYAPKIRFFGFKLEPRFKRLSETFAGFDGDQYRRTLRQFEQALTHLWENLAGGLPDMFDLPEDVGLLASQVWSDTDLSFQMGPTLAGVTDDPEHALEELFARMVLNQYERPMAMNLNDEDIWAKYAAPLPPVVKHTLQEKVLTTQDYNLKFPHAFKNGQWHLLQPIALDYSHATYTQEKASRWLGCATLLRDNPEVAKLYLLLGEPRQESNRQAYIRAKNILHKISGPHQIIEENEAADFAEYLVDYMRNHNILPKGNTDTEEKKHALPAK